MKALARWSRSSAEFGRADVMVKASEARAKEKKARSTCRALSARCVRAGRPPRKGAFEFADLRQHSRRLRFLMRFTLFELEGGKRIQRAWCPTFEFAPGNGRTAHAHAHAPSSLWC